jgi:hypothetical protein
MSSKNEQAEVNLKQFDPQTIDSLYNKYASKRKSNKANKEKKTEEHKNDAIPFIKPGEETNKENETIKEPYVSKQSFYNRNIKKLESFAKYKSPISTN